MNKDELARLIRKRATFKASLTRFNTFLDNVEATGDVFAIDSRLKINEPLYEQFQDIQSQIEDIYTDKVENERERDSFEQEYFDVIAEAQRLRQKITTSTPTLSNQPINDMTTQLVPELTNVRLPIINLPEFDGKYEDWLRFRDTFMAVVDSNSTLSQIQKFMYLMGSLKGNAYSILESFELSNNNYTVALNLLRERYENFNVIINSHVKEIVEYPPLQKENYVMLRQLLDHFLKHYRALENLKEPVKHWDTILIYIITAKLDNNTRKLWEIEQKSNTKPTVEELLKFIKERCLLLEKIYTKPAEKSERQVKVKHTNLSASTPSCSFCDGQHNIYKCDKFKALDPANRLQHVKGLRLCFNCLTAGHSVKQCSSQCCFKCDERHHTLLHKDETRTEKTTNTTRTEKTTNTTTTGQTATYGLTRKSHTWLSTARMILTHKSNSREIRVLLDNGSDCNYITKRLCVELKLPQFRDNTTVFGINNLTSTVRSTATATVKSLFGSFERKLSFLVTDEVTQNIPTNKIEVDIAYPDHVRLADPRYNIPEKVDVLIGAEIFFELLSYGQIGFGKNKPVLQNSKLGWLVTGTIRTDNPKNKPTCHAIKMMNENDSLYQLIENFWKMEQFPDDNNASSSQKTKDELQCEASFIQNTIRNENGRYVVKLPFNEKRELLGESFHTAARRFINLEKRLERNNDLKTNYVNFMKEYEQLGHMEEVEIVEENELFQEPSKFELREKGFYIPHHAVFKTTSSTTKLRVVFDASAKTTTGYSLNDALYAGPVVQSELFHILLRFRTYKLVLTADVEKMFRQVLVTPEDTNFQRILWRENKMQPLKIFRLKTVTYGTTPATYLTTKCINSLATIYKEKFSQAYRAITQDTYVDDVITGCETEEEAIKLQKDISEILSSGGFNLRKWCSNSETVLENCIENATTSKHVIKSNDDTRTLGTIWEPTADLLKFTGNLGPIPLNITKRTVLSASARVFDPLGLVSPITISFKIFLQGLWLQRLDWDDNLTTDDVQSWLKLYEELKELRNLSIPRLVIQENTANIELCEFCDASEAAYGAVLYIKSIGIHAGTANVKLLCAKTRVPL